MDANWLFLVGLIIVALLWCNNVSKEGLLNTYSYGLPEYKMPMMDCQSCSKACPPELKNQFCCQCRQNCPDMSYSPSSDMYFDKSYLIKPTMSNAHWVSWTYPGYSLKTYK